MKARDTVWQRRLRRYLLSTTLDGKERQPTDKDIAMCEPIVRAYLIGYGVLPRGCTNDNDDTNECLIEHPDVTQGAFEALSKIY